MDNKQNYISSIETEAEATLTKASSVITADNSRKRTHDEALGESNDKHINADESHSRSTNDASQSQSKLSIFQSTPLDDNVDYQALSSALSLLHSSLDRVKENIKDLKDVKTKIKEGKDLKEICSNIQSNQSFIKEISYKGVVVKCPSINWKRDYEISVDKLKDPEMLQRYEENHIKGEQYEIIRRESVFN
ncbi:hypothetical protein WICPIJ_001704 [Wickerhamomyces pijperi]|uniref:Uncharacterized protein n=1 Tax=Wickerhamomyces pijperi TaxID=599730 RepID=A0A9P8TQW5_WICPI|nr:hypothetical protein WICPIJ_001704 [Wickerhamomyces pijperi]